MDEVRRIADAVLYEGYLLWPYRRSATKNVKRWTFGGLYPPEHSARHPDDRSALQVQVLVEADAEPRVGVTVRFLQVVERRATERGVPVDELVAGGEWHLSWDEAVERELSVRAPLGIAIAGGTELEPLGVGDMEERRLSMSPPPVESDFGGCAPVGGDGAFVRSWRSLRGSADVATEQIGERRFRVTVRVANETPWSNADRDDALRSTFCSTHVVLHAEDGAFVSATEAEDCENEGVWPALVGDGSTILAAPIILSDYPEIAPESPGDLFDATEIDRMLILNVLSLTPEEQAEMRATDPRARAILERCAALGPDELLPLHGVFREVGS